MKGLYGINWIQNICDEINEDHDWSPVSVKRTILSYGIPVGLKIFKDLYLNIIIFITLFLIIIAKYTRHTTNILFPILRIIIGSLSELILLVLNHKVHSVIVFMVQNVVLVD